MGQPGLLSVCLDYKLVQILRPDRAIDMLKALVAPRLHSAG